MSTTPASMGLLPPEQVDLEPLCAVITPTGMLGYGIDEFHLTAKLEELSADGSGLPVAVIVDSGSTDSGPEKLALGTMTCPDDSYVRDLTKLVRSSIKYKVPVLVSSAGGDGSNAHLEVFVQMVKDIAVSLNCHRKLKILAVYSEIAKGLIEERMHTGDVTGCGDEVPQLTKEDLQHTPTIVAQMGPEPIFKAMVANPDFDIALIGRAYDPAPFVAFCAWSHAKSSSPPLESLTSQLLGGFYHMGKILECGGVCATPKTPGAVAMVYNDGTFDVSALDPAAICVPRSVAAHTLYEKTRPGSLVGPGGRLDLVQTQYVQLPDGITVRVTGAEFKYSIAEGGRYTVKLEGARVIGHRYLFLGSFCDPILIAQVHEYLDNVKQRCLRHVGNEGRWKLEFHVYGAPDGPVDPLNIANERSIRKEVFVIGEVLADTHALAQSVASIGRVACCHGHYRGQIATGGNFAFGMGGKTELDVGRCCQFSVYHLMNLVHGEQTGPEITTGQDTIIANGLTACGLFPWKVVATEFSPSMAETSGTTRVQTNGDNVVKMKPHHDLVQPAKDIGEATLLRDIAKVIRSKNSGPYQVTFDVIFDDVCVYEAVKKSGLLSKEAAAQLFGRSVDDIVWCGFFDQALAWKLTLPRRRNGKLCCSGGFGENDVHASQQYFPLMELRLNEELKEGLQCL